MSREFGAKPIRASPRHAIASKYFGAVDTKVINIMVSCADERAWLHRTGPASDARPSPRSNPRDAHDETESAAFISGRRLKCFYRPSGSGPTPAPALKFVAPALVWRSRDGSAIPGGSGGLRPIGYSFTAHSIRMTPTTGGKSQRNRVGSRRRGWLCVILRVLFAFTGRHATGRGRQLENRQLPIRRGTRGPGADLRGL